MSSKIINFDSNYHTVCKDKVVTLAYALFDVTDETKKEDILEYRNDLRYLHGGYESNLLKLQQAIEGFRVGMDTEVILDPRDAYGQADPALIITEPEEAFPTEARQVGIQLEGEDDQGNKQDFMVTKVEDGMITVDGNHPLAGKKLRFVVEVKHIRRASSDELLAGHAIKDTM